MLTNFAKRWLPLVAAVLIGCRSRLPKPEIGYVGPEPAHRTGIAPRHLSFTSRTPAFVLDAPLPQTLRAVREHWPVAEPSILALLPTWLDPNDVHVHRLHLAKGWRGNVEVAVFLLAAHEAGRVAWFGEARADGTFEEEHSFRRGIFLLEDAKGPR